MKKYPITTFVIFAMLISWAGWIPFAATQAGLWTVKVPAELVWLAEFGPTLSAFIVTWLVYSKTGISNLMKRLLMWKVNYKWYLLAIFITPVFILLSIGIDILFFGTKYDWSLLNDWDKNFITRTEAFTPSLGLISGIVSFMKTGTLATALMFLLLALTNGGLSEEVGWRGFALKEFQRKPYNILLTSLFVAILWAVWHTGTLFWKTMMTSSFSEGLLFAFTYLLQYLLLIFPLSVIYTVLVNGTGGSIFLAIILHAFYNISISVITAAFPGFPMLTFVICMLVFSIILIVALWRNNTYNKSLQSV